MIRPICLCVFWGVLLLQPAVAAVQSRPRIVSLSPAITALFHETGAGDYLVGVTRYCRWPADAPDPPPRVGGALDPDLEKVLACSPDLVLAGTLLPARTVKKLERLGVEVRLWRQDSLDDILEQGTRVGQLTGRELEAGKRIQQLRQSGERKPNESNKSKKHTALMVFSGDIRTVAGPGTYGQEVLAMAGLANAAAAFDLKWPNVSREWLLAANPDWIVVATHRPAPQAAAFRRECLERWRGDSLLAKLQAVRSGQVVVVPDNRLGIPSLRLFEVIPMLREAVDHSVAGEGGLL